MFNIFCNIYGASCDGCVCTQLQCLTSSLMDIVCNTMGALTHLCVYDEIADTVCKSQANNQHVVQISVEMVHEVHRKRKDEITVICFHDVEVLFLQVHSTSTAIVQVGSSRSSGINYHNKLNIFCFCNQFLELIYCFLYSLSSFL